MSALAHLTSLLKPAVEQASQPMVGDSGIDRLLRDLEVRSKGRTSGPPADDQLLAAVKDFWDSPEVRSFRQAYLLSAALNLPHQPRGPCILEDRQRLQSVLDGVDGWRHRPGAFRRCYQGLLRSYFAYDALSGEPSAGGRNNWRLLREYLHDRNGSILANGHNPGWVDTALASKAVLTEHPCEPYVEALLRGDRDELDRLCLDLGIGKASWFLRELVLAQVEGATKLSDAKFEALLPPLLSMLAQNAVLRDRGMTLVLDRYSTISGTPFHQVLSDHATGWWGNPWLPSNATRWGGVKESAREMVSDWLKGEFIEAFFTKLAQDGLGDPRRMNFWKRYVKAINHIDFALGSTAWNSTESDFVALKRKMAGLIHQLDASGANNAFIMTMGPLVAVEFSDLGNAFYGYSSDEIPFDMSRPLRLPVDGRNSLKNSSRLLKIGHGDNAHGHAKWEDHFEYRLRREFGIEPSKPLSPSSKRVIRTPSPDASAQPPSVDPGIGPYTRQALDAFAQLHQLEIRDMTTWGGNLWVIADDKNFKVHAALMRWGFKNKPGKGWWK